MRDVLEPELEPKVEQLLALRVATNWVQLGMARKESMVEVPLEAQVVANLAG